jgi:rhodanese-related sulfurtransferase
VNDQDLSGTTVVKSIIRHMDKSIPILVHSMNPKRGPIMANMLKSAGFKDVIRISMDDLNKTLFQEWLQEVRENWADEHED